MGQRSGPQRHAIVVGGPLDLGRRGPIERSERGANKRERGTSKEAAALVPGDNGAGLKGTREISRLVDEFDPESMEGCRAAQAFRKKKGATLGAKPKPGCSNSRAPMQDVLIGGLTKATKGACPIGARAGKGRQGQGLWRGKGPGQQRRQGRKQRGKPTPPQPS